MNAPRPIRIVDWPAFLFFGFAMSVLGFIAGAAIVGAFTLPATTTPVTVQLGQTVLECTWHEDRANNIRSLSC